MAIVVSLISISLVHFGQSDFSLQVEDWMTLSCSLVFATHFVLKFAAVGIVFLYDVSHVIDLVILALFDVITIHNTFNGNAPNIYIVPAVAARAIRWVRRAKFTPSSLLRRVTVLILAHTHMCCQVHSRAHSCTNGPVSAGTYVLSV